MGSMRILFDNGTPAPLRYALKGHVVVEAIERGWDWLVNGELIAEAEAAGFELFNSSNVGVNCNWCCCLLRKLLDSQAEGR